MYTAPDQIQEQQLASTSLNMWADGFELIAACTKLLAPLEKLNMWDFARGDSFWA
jgi:hypothetical protein